MSGSRPGRAPDAIERFDPRRSEPRASCRTWRCSSNDDSFTLELCRRPIMIFTKRLREGIRRGSIRCSVRIWTQSHVKVGGRYPMDDGHVVVDSLKQMRRADITRSLARESGFDSVADLLRLAKHGRGNRVYLVRFHYLAPGMADTPPVSGVDWVEKAWRRMCRDRLD